MEKQFVSYEIAAALKELRFDGDCLGKYFQQDGGIPFIQIGDNEIAEAENGGQDITFECAAPLWQQAIDWLREKHNLNVEINYLPNVSKYGVIISDRTHIPKEHGNLVNFRRAPGITCNFAKLDTYEEAREHVVLTAIERVKKVS